MTQREMADIFNNVFVNTNSKFSEKFSRTRKSPLDYLTHKGLNSFFVSPVAPVEVQNVIKSFKSCEAFVLIVIPIEIQNVSNFLNLVKLLVLIAFQYLILNNYVNIYMHSTGHS